MVDDHKLKLSLPRLKARDVRLPENQPQGFQRPHRPQIVIYVDSVMIGNKLGLQSELSNLLNIASNSIFFEIKFNVRYDDAYHCKDWTGLSGLVLHLAPLATHHPIENCEEHKRKTFSGTLTLNVFGWSDSRARLVLSFTNITGLSIKGQLGKSTAQAQETLKNLQHLRRLYLEGCNCGAVDFASMVALTHLGLSIPVSAKEITEVKLPDSLVALALEYRGVQSKAFPQNFLLKLGALRHLSEVTLVRILLHRPQHTNDRNPTDGLLQFFPNTLKRLTLSRSKATHALGTPHPTLAYLCVEDFSGPHSPATASAHSLHDQAMIINDHRSSTHASSSRRTSSDRPDSPHHLQLRALCGDSRLLTSLQTLQLRVLRLFGEASETVLIESLALYKSLEELEMPADILTSTARKQVTESKHILTVLPSSIQVLRVLAIQQDTYNAIWSFETLPHLEALSLPQCGFKVTKDDLPCSLTLIALPKTFAAALRTEMESPSRFLVICDLMNIAEEASENIWRSDEEIWSMSGHRSHWFWRDHWMTGRLHDIPERQLQWLEK